LQLCVVAILNLFPAILDLLFLVVFKMIPFYFELTASPRTLDLLLEKQLFSAIEDIPIYKASAAIYDCVLTVCARPQ